MPASIIVGTSGSAGERFAPVTARRFRLVFARGKGPDRSSFAPAPGVDLTAAMGMGGARPQPPELAEFRLLPQARVNAFEQKAGFSLADDYYALDATAGPDLKGVDPRKVIDLTSRVGPDGQLDWTPPPGRWTVLRLHDCNRSGKWFFVLFVPYLGSLMSLLLWFMPGTRGDNDHGGLPRKGNWLFLLLSLAYRSYLRAMQERDTWQVLLTASRELLQVDEADLVEVVLERSAGLFDADVVEVVVAIDGKGLTARSGSRRFNGDTDWRSVVATLTGPVPGGQPLWYQKHMSHHMLPDIAHDWIHQLVNVFLIRDPADVVTSYIKSRATVTSEDIGLEQEWRLFDEIAQRTGTVPPVIDASAFLKAPEPHLRALCAHLGIAFTDRMLHWPAGPRDSDGHWHRIEPVMQEDEIRSVAADISSRGRRH